jgi:hypothetical protein
MKRLVTSEGLVHLAAIEHAMVIVNAPLAMTGAVAPFRSGSGARSLSIRRR